MTTALVLGATRGIGLEFVRQFIADGSRVFATHRSEEGRLMLRDLGANTLRLDVTNPDDVAALAWQVKGEAIDQVIINAGVYGPRDSTVQQAPSDEDFDLVFRTNVLGTMRLVPVVVPLLRERRGTLAFLSSKMGSISEASAGYGMLYRASKSAVNMVAKLTHEQFHATGVRVLALHPGWVRTDMGGSNAEVETHDSVAGLREVIANDKKYTSGSFLDYRGETIDW